MAVTSGFFNSLNGDRKYNNDQFSALFDNLITDGVFANVGTAFEVRVSSENTVTVGVGRAWFNSIWVYNDSLYPMVVQGTEVLLDRIDAIVIEINHNEAVRTGSIRWVYGSPGSSPSRPNLTNTDEVHQYPLAYVLRKAGRSSVIQADITNAIGTSECPYVTGILSTQNIDKVVAQWQSQFSTWFEGLDAALSGDVAANLANQMIGIQSRFQTLAREKAVYEELQDSSGSVIQDRNGSDVLAKTVLSGGGDVIINYNSGQGNNEEGALKVGDILTTARRDLDSKWRLCNGAILDSNVYTQLASKIPPSPGCPYIEKTTFTDTRSRTMNKVGYGNGYYFVYTSAYSRILWYIHESNVASGQWVNGGDPFGVEIDPNSSIVYGNGYYVAVYRASSSTARVYYSTSLTGPYSYVDISSCYLRSITYTSNGLFMIAGKDQSVSKPAVWYATNPAGPWSKSSAITATESISSVVKYLNGYYVALVTDDSGIYYASSLTGGWAQIPGSSGINFEDLDYGNGSYVFTMYNGTSSDRGIYYTHSLNSPLVKATVDFPETPYELAKFYDIAFDGAYILITATYKPESDYTNARYCVLYSPSASIEFQVKELCTFKAMTSDVQSFGIVSGGTHYAVSCSLYDGETYYYNVYFGAKNQLMLPEISIGSGGYSYIKVEE